MRVTDAGTPPLTATVTVVVRVNVTRHQRHGVDGRPTSKNLALPLVLVAAAAVVLMLICILAARRIGPLDRTSEMQRSMTYMSAAAGYVSQTSIDDITCAADCSTDVALGSTVRLQVTTQISTLFNAVMVFDSWSIDFTVLVI